MTSGDGEGPDVSGTVGGSTVGGSTAELAELLADWVPRQRWFAAKGQKLGAVRIDSRIVVSPSLAGAEDATDDQAAESRPRRPVEQVLISVEAESGVQRYQIFVGWAAELPERLAASVIGTAGGQTAYGALHDADFSALLIRLIAKDRASMAGELQFRAEPGAEIGTAGPPMVFGAEQSNTSIIYGHSAILKVFRRLEPGPNPDAEVHRALRAQGSTSVAPALGTIEGLVDGLPTTLALLTGYFGNSADGWAMATASVRDLMAEGDLRADEVGGDFAAEAIRLGRAVASVHADLAAAFGTEDAGPAGVDELLAEMRATAEATAAHVPSLAAQLDGIRAAFSGPAGGSAMPVQRIHGDLHLGQTLRTLTGWAVIDFEGEPSKKLAYRRSMHSPLRDIAGMLRSFDYAAHHSGGAMDPQHAYRATEWATRNRNAFCEGYAAVSGSDPREHGPLLTAFELDKAVYEVAYEHGHRPSWEPIPLQAVSRLITHGGTT